MSSQTSLESLLQSLVNSPEEDKRALARAAVGLLREVCTIHTKSSYSKFQEIADKARNILDRVLVGKVEDSDEEEFLESGDFPLSEGAEAYTKSKTPILAGPEGVVFAAEENVKPMLEKPSVLKELQDLLNKWNSKSEPWLQIVLPKSNSESSGSKDIIKSLIQKASAVRSNLISATGSSHSTKEDIKRFEKSWKLWVDEIAKQGYTVFPDKYGKMEETYGEVLYSYRPSITEKEITLITPGVKGEQDTILMPLTLVALPVDAPFPDDHPDHDLPFQWRAILAEFELLFKHIVMQDSVLCAVEAINKTRVEPFAQCADTVINEMRRRADALRTAIRQKENIYRLATNYWRVEECFWAIFQDDGRPRGCSFFDRLRRRVQAWHTMIRKTDNIYVKDFDPINDPLASVNKYIGNIILQSKQGVPPGTVLRELRPAVIVKVNNMTRVLKGRVIAT